jgi:hypothetical protein
MRKVGQIRWATLGPVVNDPLALTALQGPQRMGSAAWEGTEA